MTALRKAVIPAAGRGTRSLPASKAVPKELLPLVDKPAIQYVVEEANAAGLGDVGIITAPDKGAILAHFAADPALEAALADAANEDLLAAVRGASGLGPVTPIVQDHPRGLGDAVACAEEFVEGEAFAVLLADDLIDARDPALATMMAIHAVTGGSVLLLVEVAPDRIGHYGCVDAHPVDERTFAGAAGVPQGAEIHELTRFIEKPARGEEYSNLAIIGRYVFTSAIFDALRSTQAGRLGEVQLTDAIARLASVPASQGGGVYGLVHRGRRYDTGDKLEYLKAVVQIAADRPDLGAAFREWLGSFVADLGEAK